MQLVDTTMRELRKGVKIREHVAQVRYEPTGHLSVRLMDAAGAQPLAGASFEVDLPEDGPRVLTTDRRGRVLHRDVPFQDYELTLTLASGEVKLSVPAVASTDEVHARHVPDCPYAYLDVELRDADEWRLGGVRVRVEGGGKVVELETDDAGRVARALPFPPGKVTLEAQGRSVEVELPALPVRRVVIL